MSTHDVQRTSEAPTGLLNGTDALPVEQWTRCCEFVAEGSDAIKVKEDLHALSLTSSLLRDIAQPMIFRSLVYTPQPTVAETETCNNFHSLVSSRLANSVRELTLLGPEDPMKTEPKETYGFYFNSLVNFKNLRQLSLGNLPIDPHLFECLLPKLSKLENVSIVCDLDGPINIALPLREVLLAGSNQPAPPPSLNSPIRFLQNNKLEVLSIGPGHWIPQVLRDLADGGPLPALKELRARVRHPEIFTAIAIALPLFHNLRTVTILDEHVQDLAYPEPLPPFTLPKLDKYAGPAQFMGFFAAASHLVTILLTDRTFFTFPQHNAFHPYHPADEYFERHFTGVLGGQEATARLKYLNVGAPIPLVVAQTLFRAFASSMRCLEILTLTVMDRQLLDLEHEGDEINDNFELEQDSEALLHEIAAITLTNHTTLACPDSLDYQGLIMEICNGQLTLPPHLQSLELRQSPGLSTLKLPQAKQHYLATLLGFSYPKLKFVGLGKYSPRGFHNVQIRCCTPSPCEWAWSEVSKIQSAPRGGDGKLLDQENYMHKCEDRVCQERALEQPEIKARVQRWKEAMQKQGIEAPPGAWWYHTNSI